MPVPVVSPISKIVSSSQPLPDEGVHADSAIACDVLRDSKCLCSYEDKNYN